MTLVRLSRCDVRYEGCFCRAGGEVARQLTTLNVSLPRRFGAMQQMQRAGSSACRGIIKTTADGALIECGSAVDAVRTARDRRHDHVLGIR